MSGHSHDPVLMETLCKRMHAGEKKVALQTETGISTTTLVKRYREWCIKNGYKENKPVTNFTPPNTVKEVLQAHIKPPEPKQPIIAPQIPAGATVLAIPDMHHPFAHPDALAFLLEVRRVKHTNLTVCMGDEIDAASFSRYIPDPDGMSPGKELAAAIECLIPFYREFPDMLVCESNHTVRPWKKGFEAGLPAAFLPTYATILQSPDGWKWAGKWEIDGVLYIHGDNGKSGQYAHVNYMKAAKQSVVIGHIHSYAGVNYEGKHFGVNTGCLIDETAYCFKYAKNMLTKVNLGCAVIYEGKYAEFVPMRLDSNGRWIGRL